MELKDGVYKVVTKYGHCEDKSPASSRLSFISFDYTRGESAASSKIQCVESHWNYPTLGLPAAAGNMFTYG